VSEASRMRALLVDPSLFTAPYDAALTLGLVDAGVEPSWAVRPLRPGDRQEIAAEYVDPFFYRRVDKLASGSLRAAFKGVAHALGLARLISRVARQRPAVVHFQWLVVPPLDSLAILLLKNFAPVVITVHDTVPFNGEYMSLWQNLAFDLPLKLADGVIVHTQAGRDRLLQRGVAPEKLSVIQHGPLPLGAEPSPASMSEASHDPRMTFVLFGEIKSYKGLDLLVEALGQLPQEAREQARVVVAGRERMDLTPIRSRIAELGLEQTIEIRAQRQSEQEMADLFARTDCFLFPYRQIDASGVYFLVKSLGKWLIASNVGIFAEDLLVGEQGELVPVADVTALAAAIASAIAKRPKPKPVATSLEWASIGRKTREFYQASLARRSPGRDVAAAPSLAPLEPPP